MAAFITVVILFLIVLPFTLVAVKFFYLIVFGSKSPFLKNKARTIIVMGSGGHTMEMVMLMKTLDPNLYQPRLYLVADNDFSSEHKIKELEEEFEKVSRSQYKIVKIPRSRSVSQPTMSSMLSTLHALISCFPVVYSFKPDVILTNGPGTCVPACLTAFCINCAYNREIRIVYVESICRVKTLSLTGKIMLYIADLVFVQWEELNKLYPSTILLNQPL